MKKKNQPPKKQTNVRGFLADLKKLDKKLLVIVIIVAVIAFFVGQNIPTGAIFGVSTEFFEKPEILSAPTDIEPALYPKKITNEKPPTITALAAIVIDADSHVVLYEKNQDTRFPLASTTKIMTALVAMEYFDLSDIVTVPDFAIEGAKMDLIAGEQISFQNLLYGLLLPSGNDAAETIARQSSIGRQAFIAKMNEKAKTLHLVNTTYEDPTGLSSANQTTALDLARLAAIALKNPIIFDITSTKKKIVTDVTQTHVHTLENLNKLLGEVEGVIGLKTGFTEEAGQVLVTAVLRNEHTIVSVVLRSEDRFADSKVLLEWAFANYIFTR